MRFFDTDSAAEREDARIMEDKILNRDMREQPRQGCRMTSERLAEIRCIISRGDTMLADLLASHDALVKALQTIASSRGLAFCHEQARAALKQSGVAE